jgi:hypothetical protein
LRVESPGDCMAAFYRVSAEDVFTTKLTLF